ncbi:Glutathione S-transferase Mu 3, partial [Pseudolycoriella hygida]
VSCIDNKVLQIINQKLEALSMAMIHGYWNIRGYAQPIRLLLAHAGAEYEDKRYNYGSTPETLRSECTHSQSDYFLPKLVLNTKTRDTILDQLPILGQRNDYRAKPTNMVLILGNWRIRGYAQPIRLLLAHACAQYEDKRYDFGPTPDTWTTEWLKEKFNLGLDFPNLPYLFDGDVKMTQSIAILRYLGRKFKLVPSNEREGARVYMLEQEILDWRTQQSELFYNSNFESSKGAYIEGLKGKVKSLSTFLGNNDFFSGGGLTYVDFLVYEWLDVNRLFYPELLNGIDNLENFQKRIESLPNIADYIKSEKFIKFPLNGIMAEWGGK